MSEKTEANIDSAPTEGQAPVDGEKMVFQAEVNQLLQLMIHSLYSNQEIFLRELISNSSDACDKLRFESIENASLLESDPELRVVVSVDEEAGTVTVSDNGIGMNRDEVIANIGTIAKSGTKQFLESLSGDQKADAKLIGQFGVGFYSAFVVADSVVLVTRKAGENGDTGVRWESDASGGYTLSAVDKPVRGTEITLKLKEESKEFLNDYRLRGVIKKYSDHITFPIMMLGEVPPAPEPEEGEEAVVEEPQVAQLEQVNDASALWTRPKSTIKDEEYQNFYKQVCNDYEDALIWSHNKVEGNQEYTSLLYVPKKAPFDLYDGNHQRNGIKLFVQRVFIMDEAEKLMPRYLRFVRGLVDSNDLPLNVSREILQDNKTIDAIRNASIKRVLGMLEKLADKQPEDYAGFWTEFGACLKEAPGEDFANKEQVAKLYRFDTTNNDKVGELTSLDDYIARMKVGQDKLYYITADSYQAAKNSPHLEIFRDKGIEVLLMHDRVDEWMMSYLNEYDSKSFVSIAKGDLDLGSIEGVEQESDEVKAEKEKKAVDIAPTIERIKAVLGDTTSDVRASTRLTSSPACIVMGQHDMALHMQQLLKQAGHDLPSSKPVLEVNPTHPILDLMDNEQDDERFKDWSHLLLDQALLADGGQLEDSAGFVKRMNDMFLALKA
ncbi:Chaperone protein HtpG [Granulosicoccus antarcticus IMCC3135]|uniref:Chaperone protein HtpG n=2 Tax=Granulosicoccus TaxID=437504 RepID=A0A2Z2NX33_9GAMM|nr:Chaperone protein HtpG [Granulosicoccus antarcticus IMCC3135]